MTRLPLVLVFAFIALLVACDNGDGGESAAPDVTISPYAPGEMPPPTSESEVCQPNPDPAPSDVLVIDQPSAEETVASPVTISGQVAAFEAQFNITIYDADGNEIVDVPATSEEGQVLSPFSEDVEFAVTEETPACIWVYDVSEADGSPSNVGQIPVTLSP